MCCTFFNKETAVGKQFSFQSPVLVGGFFFLQKSKTSKKIVSHEHKLQLSSNFTFILFFLQVSPFVGTHSTLYTEALYKFGCCFARGYDYSFNFCSTYIGCCGFTRYSIRRKSLTTLSPHSSYF